MKLLTFTLGNLYTNCYILINEETNMAIAIDIGGDDALLKLEELKHNFKINYVLLTHGHFDHIGGVTAFYKRGATVYMGEDELDFITDKSLNLVELVGGDIKPFNAIGVKDNEELILNDIKIKVIKTSGHTKGSVSYIVEDKIFVGDVIFDGSFGRIDFPTGNVKQLVNSCKRVCSYEGYTIYPGHGEKTTTLEEKDTNPIFYYD